MGRYDPTTTGQLIARLRASLGHLGSRDRDVVLTAIDALLELSQRLHDATHAARAPVPTTPAFTLTTIPDDDAAKVE